MQESSGLCFTFIHLIRPNKIYREINSSKKDGKFQLATIPEKNKVDNVKLKHHKRSSC